MFKEGEEGEERGLVVVVGIVFFFSTPLLSEVVDMKDRDEEDKEYEGNDVGVTCALTK